MTQSSKRIGIRTIDSSGRPLVDAVAGRKCALGFGSEVIHEALMQTAEEDLGDCSSANEIVSDDNQDLASALGDLLGSTSRVTCITADSVLVFPDADLAIEAMISFARKRKGGMSYRTIAIVGSDHGRTALCRSASGIPALQSDFGPMVAGFDHVSANDLKGLEAAIDDSTTAILLSPIDLADAARSLSDEYLRGVRRLCDDHDLMLLIDESRLCFGASGECFSIASLSNIPVDGIVVAGGLFSGLPGGILVASEKLTLKPMHNSASYPLQSNLAAAVLVELHRRQTLSTVAETAQSLSVALAEKISEVEYIRDIHATGMTIGIETDVQASEMILVAQNNGLRIEAAGETSVRLQPPLTLSIEDRETLVELFLETMHLLEQNADQLTN